MPCRCHKLSRFLCPFLSAVAVLKKDCRHILRSCRLSAKPLGGPRDRLLGANLTGCDVNFCWMIQIQKKCRQSVLPRSPRPWTLDQLQNPLFLSCFYTECPQGRPCLGFGRVSFFTRDALKGHTVSKNGSISFFSSSYPQIGTLIYSLNSPLSYSGCIVLIVFNKSRPIKIHSCRLYCEGGDPLTPTCVTSKHHLINTGLNLCRHIVNMFWTQVCRFQTEISPF